MDTCGWFTSKPMTMVGSSRSSERPPSFGKWRLAPPSFKLTLRSTPAWYDGEVMCWPVAFPVWTHCVGIMAFVCDQLSERDSSVRPLAQAAA